MERWKKLAGGVCIGFLLNAAPLSADANRELLLAQVDPPAGEAKPDESKKGDKPAPTVADKLAALRQLLESQPESPEQIKKLLRDVVDLAEDVLKDPRATEVEKENAYRAFLGNLSYGALEGIDGFDPRLRAESARLLKEKPEDEAAAFAAYQVLRLDNRGPTGALKPSALDAVVKYIDQFTKHPVYGSRMLMEIGDAADNDNDVATASKALRLLKEKFPESPEAQAVDGMIRRIEAVGKPFAFEATLLDGKPLDPQSLKDKVVVLDFWATWCGPCVAEIPNLKKLYDEFHGKGLEIVGVSLDDDKGVLDTFVDEQEIPWIQTFEDLGGKKDHPLATRYGIMGIPTMFLVGKDGKLISTKLRGPSLEAKVRELLSDAKPNPKS